MTKIQNLVPEVAPSLTSRVKGKISRFAERLGINSSHRKEDLPCDIAEFSLGKEVKNSKKFFALTEARNKLEQKMDEIQTLIATTTGPAKEKLMQKLETMQNLYKKIVKAREAEVKTVEYVQAKEVKNSTKFFALTEARNKLEQQMAELKNLIATSTGTIKESLIKKLENMQISYQEVVKARESEIKTVMVPKTWD